MNTGYKYGRKTKAQIDALPTGGLAVGDNVYNTTIKKEEYWTGNTWINPDCIELFNNSGLTMLEGEVVQLDTTTITAGRIIKGDSSTDDQLVGIIYRGAATGNYVVAAQCGVYNILINSASADVTRGHVMVVSTVGTSITSGAKSSGAGATGVALETKATPTNVLVKCMVNLGDNV
jgi:hypothetical protein